MSQTNVVQIGTFRSKQSKLPEKRPCSFTTVSDKGNVVHGIAAFLVVSKRKGGVDRTIKSIAADAAEEALQKAIKGGQQKIG